MEIDKNVLLKQNQATEGSPAFPLQFNNQDFVKLQNYCLHQGLLFEDDTFPANSYSIGFTSNLFPQEKLRKVQWLRPHARVRNPCLFVDGISRFDILQGQRIGNCWVLAALGALTQKQQFLENVIPKDQGFNHTYAGIFHFQFWYFGSWVDVVIDDRLPFIDGNYLSVHPKSNNEFWPPLLEKAYAKLRGSYEKLHYGFISEAFVDLTGGVQLTFNLRSPTDPLFEIMKSAALSGCLMACSTQMKKPGSQVLENGIVQQHVYAVIDATEVPYIYRKEPLIKLWNPWGTVEWNGAWSDHSVEWDQVPQSFKDKLYVNRADGEFWISFEDLKDNFSSLSVCNNLPTFLDFGKKSSTSWSLVSYFNQLSPEGSTFQSTLSRNHQYFIEVPEFMTKYNVVVALTQRPANTSRMLVHMGFQLKKGRTIVHDTHLNVTRDITTYYQLKPGDYTITPTTSPQNQELKFLLRIFLRSQGDIRKPNNEFSSETTMMQSMLVSDPDNYESVFLRYASQNSYLDASQLQRILNGVLLKDLMAGLGTGDGFSFDSCKSLLALMDINANGKLSLQEFKRLWRAFKKYEDIFGREDENNSGFLTVSNLRRIVQETGTYVSDKVLQLLVLRYGDSTQRINFPDFVCCMFRLETMAKAFLNLSKNTGSICFTEDEWMTMIMYC